MPKRLKALSHDLRDLLPGSWPIRSRLISAGIALSLLALATPFYLRTRLAALATTYSSASSKWDEVDRIRAFGGRLTDAQTHLRAFQSSGDTHWLDPFPRDRAEMDRILAQFWRSAADKPQRAALLKELSDSYRHWLRDVAEPIVAGRKPSPAGARRSTPGLDPTSYHIHRLLAELADDLHAETTAANNTLMARTRRTVLTVTYGGVVFFFGFVALMLSLWFTLIPDLGALLGAAKELKKGNLDYRVYLSGRSETAQLGRAFNEMAISLKERSEKLTELNRLKTDFVSTVSHELRTPLTAIKGSIGLILGGVTGSIPAEAEEMLGITQKNTDRLIRLINEVLDVAKIEAGAIQMHFDKFSLVETISHAILGIEAFAQTSGIRIEWEKPQISPLVVIDRDRIEQVITNLLSNAIKFSEKGGKVAVRVSWEKDRVVIEVTDMGEGIPEEFLERIFQKFQQAESAAHKAKEGTGLGLTIARAIVEEHGGTIWVQSKIGTGSTFSFSLPWNGSEFVEGRSRGQAPAVASTSHTILLVDDEPDFTRVTARMLEHEGYRVVTADTARRGVELAIAEKPDLILLDIMMPDIDGPAARKLLRDNAATRDLPVAFVTVSADAHVAESVRDAAHVFTKPLPPDELKSWLSRFFSSKPKAKAA